MYGVGVPETLVEVGGSDAGKRLALRYVFDRRFTASYLYFGFRRRRFITTWLYLVFRRRRFFNRFSISENARHPRTAAVMRSA